MAKISIIGTGYVGLISGACFSEIGHHVTCVDLDEVKVNNINNKTPPIYEAGLQELLDKNVGVTLFATNDLQDAVLNSDYTFIAVGTPYKGDYIDLTFIKESAKQIGQVLKDKSSHHTVIVKSTVIPKTTSDVVKPIIEKYSQKNIGTDIGLVMNPEFLREGVAIDDFMNPDRVVIGGFDEHSSKLVKSLYDFYFDTDYVLTDTTTAEMIKYSANSLLATLISFSNEIGNLCATVGVDSQEVERGVCLDERFSPFVNNERVFPTSIKYLEAGCGFGGSCFPKDIKALHAFGEKQNLNMQMLNSVININKAQPQQIISILKNKVLNYKNKKNILILGAAFKSNTDDIRESATIPVIEMLLEMKFKISLYDPVAGKNMHKLFKEKIFLEDSLASSIQTNDIVILMTMWDEFFDLPNIINKIKPDIDLIDGRRQIGKNSVKNYFGIGLG
tara:strand:+ start:752 stop:2089 length:1338 start_codon:yes stop_codon:yes gene_type:complete